MHNKHRSHSDSGWRLSAETSLIINKVQLIVDYLAVEGPRDGALRLKDSEPAGALRSCILWEKSSSAISFDLLLFPFQPMVFEVPGLIKLNWFTI